MPVVTYEPIQLSYFVPDIAAATATYNRIRWHRSRTGQYGLYEPATASAPGPAALRGGSVSPHQISGRVLSFRVNGTRVDVTFADPDPVTTAQAAAVINAATLALVASDSDGRLLLTTAATGSGASIEILESEAAAYLGFSAGDGAVGTDPDTILVNGTHEYFYVDQNSDETFWYRVEFVHSVSSVTTGLGVPFPANPADRVPSSQTIVCYLRLAGLDGSPIAGRRVTFHNAFLPNVVLEQQLDARRWGVFRHSAEMVTDRNGYAEIRLLRGIQIDMAIDGTNFVRKITIPTLGDGVDLLNPALSTEDEFGIQEPNIDFAIRTS